MKITYINNSKLPSTEAPSVHVMKMCHALSKDGHEVVLVGVRKGGKKDVYKYYNVPPSFKIEYVAKPNLKFIGQLTNLFLSVLIAKSMGSDMVYTRFDIGAYISALLGNPTVYECHNPVIYSGQGRFREMIFKRLLRRRELIMLVVISDSTKRYIIENYSIEPENIILARDSADPISPDTVPMEFCNKGKLQVGYIGSLYRGRGKSIIRYLAENCEFAHFHVVGGTPEELKISESELDHPNITLHGFVPQHEVPGYLMGCDVLLAPYQRDVRTAGGMHNAALWMSPLKVFEYMSSGRAIIASDLPAIREILVHGEDALLCDPEDRGQWKRALVRLYEDPGSRGDIGEQARRKFIENYTWDKRAKFIVEEIRRRSESL